MASVTAARGRVESRSLPHMAGLRLLVAILFVDTCVYATIPRFRSDSVIGDDVQCTEPEKLCFQFNRVLSTTDGRCLPLGTDCNVGEHRHLDGKVKLFINRTESNVHNRFQATCRKTYCEDRNDKNKLCPIPFVSYKDTRKLCGNLPIYNNMFDDLECVCPQCKQHDRVVQPSEIGKCTVPDLWRSYRGALDVIRAPCSEEDIQCFQEGKVLYDGACHVPLDNAACGVEQWLVLDEGLYKRDKQLKAACALRKCSSPDEVWMAFSERCHPKSEVAARVCVGGSLLREDAFGRGDCVPPGQTPFGLPLYRTPEECYAPPLVTQLVQFRAELECEMDAGGNCVL